MMKMLFKISSFVLCGMFYSFVSLSQSEKQILSDGLLLSILMETNQFEQIEELLAHNDFRYNQDLTQDGIISYIKFFESGSALGISFDYNGEYNRVVFIPMGSDFAFTTFKLRNSLNNSRLIIKKDESKYLFYVSSRDKLSDDQDQPDVNHEFASEIEFRDSLIIFYTPLFMNEVIEWERAIVELIEDFIVL